MAGWTVVGGFGLRDLCLVESPLYLRPFDEHRCAFALIETINNLVSQIVTKQGRFHMTNSY